VNGADSEGCIFDHQANWTECFQETNKLMSICSILGKLLNSAI